MTPLRGTRTSTEGVWRGEGNTKKAHLMDLVYLGGWKTNTLWPEFAVYGAGALFATVWTTVNSGGKYLEISDRREREKEKWEIKRNIFVCFA